MTDKVGMVIGASGLVGSNLAEHISELDGWRVIGVSRRKPDGNVPYDHLPFDILDAGQCRDAIRKRPDVTHVFLAARTKGIPYAEEEAKNVEILRNLLDALETEAADFRHINIVHGTKWYGVHIGATQVPFREDDARHMPPNPYYAQQDYVTERAKGQKWSWTAVRPSLVSGFSFGYPHNLICLTGVYAAISRELGVPLRFPGSHYCYESLQTGVDVSILSKAMVWMSENPKAAGEAFNLANGDVFSWTNIWPRVAKFFGMEIGHIQKLSLVDYMADKDPVWARIVKKHGLRPSTLRDLVTWDYGDFHYNKGGYDIPSLIKIWKAGFHEVADTENLFLEILQKYRDARVLP